MEKVMLLASGEFFEQLYNKLGKTYTVYHVSDSIHAERVLLMKPDALILNMSLSGMDSLKFLKDHAENLPPVIMATTSYISNTLINELSALDVAYLIRLPCSLDILQDRLAEQLAKKCLS